MHRRYRGTGLGRVYRGFVLEVAELQEPRIARMRASREVIVALSGS